MDRNTALSALIDLRQILIEEDRPKIAEAVGVGIEALVVQDRHIKAIERMIEGAKEINKFLEEAAKESDEKHQLSGETSTISEKHQLMLPLDDAVKVVGRICDEWWTLEDGDIEFIRNELEQKCYRIDQTTDCISRKQAIEAVVNEWKGGFPQTNFLRTQGFHDWLKRILDNLPPVNKNNAEIATSDGEESTMGQPKSKLDCISRQQAIDGLCQNCEAFDCIVNGSYCGHDCTEVAILKNLPPVTPKPIDDCISRQDAIEALEHIHIPTQAQREYAWEIFDKIPPVEPKRPKGEWIVDSTELKLTCSECKATFSFDDVDELLDFKEDAKFCIECGAKMKGGTE